MEFNEKLQQLRTGKNLTQEQLAEQLYVSRTAISKWESGKGYPNIESLKCISKFFSVTIDELLSGEELITLAETENRSNLKKIYSFIYGILDMMAVTFILLPLYGNLVDGYIYSVNLLSFTDTTPIYLAIYWIVFIVLIALGIAKLMCVSARPCPPRYAALFWYPRRMWPSPESEWAHGKWRRGRCSEAGAVPATGWRRHFPGPYHSHAPAVR